MPGAISKLLTFTGFYTCINDSKIRNEKYLPPFQRDGTPDEENRIENVMREIDERGTYELELTELIFGAKTAWRNSLRCIGRIQWNKLQVNKT